MARSADPDGIAVARLHGHASYAMEHKTPRGQAIAELREITPRPDLLAESAGIIAGAAHRDWGDWPMRREWARLLLDAGADREKFRDWVRVGIERRQLHAGRPFEGPRPVQPVDEAEVDAVIADVLAD